MEFLKGMDISMLSELEKKGIRYYNHGREEELLGILKENGVNAIRLRIWNNPYDEKGNPYGGGTNDLVSVLKMAERIKEKGMQFFLDFHYSDFWTDPKKQIKPKAWKELSGKKLGTAVYDYTKMVLEELQKRDILPDMVQVGNEITNGFLWPDGQLKAYRNLEEQQPKREYESLFFLLERGIQAVREVDSNIEIVLHLDFGGDNGLYREWFDEAEKHRLDYDIIGLSYYPYWHENLTKLEENLQDISQRYEKAVLVAETSYGFTLEEKEGCSLVFSKELAEKGGYEPAPEGQAQFLKDLIACIERVKKNRGRGFFYWEPAWIPGGNSTWASVEGQKYMNDMAPEGNTWANQALFDYEGNVLPALEMLKNIHKNK